MYRSERGKYSLATTVPLAVTQAANGTLFSFRWADTTHHCEILALRLTLLQLTAATATIAPIYSAFIARGFSVADSVGTALTITGDSFKLDDGAETTLVTDIRKSAVAAGNTVGTRTLDGDPILQMQTVSTITAPNQTFYERDLLTTRAQRILRLNEGLIIQGPSIVFGAAGTASLGVELVWAEKLP